MSSWLDVEIKMKSLKKPGKSMDILVIDNALRFPSNSHNWRYKFITWSGCWMKGTSLMHCRPWTFSYVWTINHHRRCFHQVVINIYSPQLLLLSLVVAVARCWHLMAPPNDWLCPWRSRDRRLVSLSFSWKPPVSKTSRDLSMEWSCSQPTFSNRRSVDNFIRKVPMDHGWGSRR